MAGVLGAIVKDTFTHTTVAGYQEILFAFTNINPPCVIKDITIVLAPPTPGDAVSISVEMIRGSQNYYLINKVGYTFNHISSDNTPFWLDANTTSGSFKITAPVGTTFTVAFTAVCIPASSTYNSKIQGVYDQTLSFSSPLTMYTNATSGFQMIKGISLALPIPTNLNVSLFYSDQSGTVPFGTASFAAAASNSSFVTVSPTFAYLLSGGASILITGDVNSIPIDYFIHWTS